MVAHGLPKRCCHGVVVLLNGLRFIRINLIKKEIKKIAKFNFILIKMSICCMPMAQQVKVAWMSSLNMLKLK